MSPLPFIILITEIFFTETVNEKSYLSIFTIKSFLSQEWLIKNLEHRRSYLFYFVRNNINKI